MSKFFLQESGIDIELCIETSNSITAVGIHNVSITNCSKIIEICKYIKLIPKIELVFKLENDI